MPHNEKPKIVIQIPCHNEEEALGTTLESLSAALKDFESVETLIIDDGSSDGTVDVARAHGVDHIVRLPTRQGLAKAFLAGLDASLAAGADIIVNTDADNQYNAADIPALVAPVLEGQADIVIGERPIDEIGHFSPVKKILQKIGSWAVRLASKTTIPDAPSGFRAFSRDAAMRLHVFNDYTYTLETIIQAGQKNMAIVSVPIRVNEELRPSRLVKSIPTYVRKSLLTIVRIFMTYRPFRFFAVPGMAIAAIGILIGVRFLVFFFSGSGEGHVQSLILAALLISTGFFMVVVGLLADLIAVNRKLLEEIDWRTRKVEEKMIAVLQHSRSVGVAPHKDETKTHR
jgi:glycosyltransferase involved in cell wall biosynthesis